GVVQGAVDGVGPVVVGGAGQVGLLAPAGRTEVGAGPGLGLVHVDVETTGAGRRRGPGPLGGQAGVGREGLAAGDAEDGEGVAGGQAPVVALGPGDVEAVATPNLYLSFGVVGGLEA